ncbi:MAG: arsenate reductase family protein [Chlorobiaceae bacterium]|nr:arsenate reductase family protein [Chlorobiaceae bacterium]
MEKILFFEKPGCRNNARQKAMLELSGNPVEAVSILDYPWTKEELAPFLGEKPAAECLNPSAPAVKSGEVDPEALTKEEAIEMMVREPILIKRPLMKIGQRCLQGFDTATLREIISLDAVPGAENVVRSLKMTDLDSCPLNSGFSCTNPEH